MANSKNPNFLYKIRIFLLSLLPVSLFFSYYPLITLGEATTLNLELSIPLIILFLFAVFSIPTVFCCLRKTLSDSQKSRHFSLIFPLIFIIYLSLSLIWTKNFLRGFLTTGIVFCIAISVISMLDLYKTQKCCKNYNTFLLKLYLCSTATICLFCWTQCILDVLGINREATLLCLGCTSETFGFPRPSGFAIEPQFMGNLLLLPSLLSLYFLIKPEKSPFSKKISVFLSIIIIFTLFLTFSRGAIYSFVVAFFVLICLEPKKPRTRLILPIFVSIFAFSLSLLSQGLMSELSPYNSTFLSGISSSISQLSLGLIELPTPVKPVENPVENSQPAQETSQNPTPEPPTPEESPENSAPDSPIFDGYVEESTNTRLMLSSLAWKSWTSSPVSLLFGYGIGSSGVVINEFFPDLVDNKEIIQNEPLAIALELGLVGIILVLICLYFALKRLKSSPNFPLYLAIIIAFFVSLMFFSGLPNALHIYLLPPLVFLCLEQQKSVQKSTQNPR